MLIDKTLTVDFGVMQRHLRQAAVLLSLQILLLMLGIYAPLGGILFAHSRGAGKPT